MRLNLVLVPLAASFWGIGLSQTLDHSIRQIAIIGAGAAGSSAAYFLRNSTTGVGVNVNITLFEKTDRIGGRTLTIHPYNDPAQRLELGASIFVEANRILNDAAAEFGLPTRAPDTESSPVLGIWDGDRFVFTLDLSEPSWRNNLKIVWRYGVTAPLRAQRLMAATRAKFLQIYDAPYFPFSSLTRIAKDLGLVATTGVTGEQFLGANKVDALFAREVVQAATRVNYASNIDSLHGLDAMVSMGADGATAVRGGNWRIFHEMVHRSGAHIAVNTTVAQIAKISGVASRRPRYTVQTASSNTPEAVIAYPVVFDNVIIANPFQFSGISAGDGVLKTPIDAVPYVQLYVTIFTTPSWLSPEFFGLPETQQPPGLVLTTLPSAEGPDGMKQGAGKAGFFSLSKLGTATNPRTHQQENVFKVFSPGALTAVFLSRLIGAAVPETFTGKASPITWYHAHVFNSYPKAYPRVTFQDPVVGEGVYYTSGMESFISCMETTALMGKNVARLIVDDILASGSSRQSVKAGVGGAWEDGQKVLG